MPSPFDEIDAAGQAVISQRLGEGVLFSGTIGGDYSSAPDPARPAQMVRAVVALSPRIGKVSDGIQGRSSSGATRISSSSELWISVADWAAVQWVPKQGDTVTIRPGETGEREFTISAVMPMDHDDIQIILSEGAGR
jgi:hypothetical protein